MVSYFRDDVYHSSFAEFASLALSTPLDTHLESVITSRPLVVTMIADHVAFLVSCARELKELARTPKPKRPTALIHADESEMVAVSKPNQLSVVLIGCGGVGSVIANRLVEGKVIHPTSLHLMSRQPHTLSKFSKRGCRCGVVHVPSVESADVVIISTLPGQLSVVSQQIQGHLKASAVVLSVCTGVSSDKICTELRHPLCLCLAAENVGGVSRVAATVDFHRPTRPQCVIPLIDCMYPFTASQPASAPSQPTPLVAAPVATNQPALQHHENQFLVTSSPAGRSTEAGRGGTERDTGPATATRGDGALAMDEAVDAGDIVVSKPLRSQLYRVVYVMAASATAAGLPFHESTFAVWGLFSSRRAQAKWSSSFSDHPCPGSSIGTTGTKGRDADGSGETFDPVRFSFSSGMHFSKLVGVSEKSLIQGFRERLQLFLPSLPLTSANGGM